MLDRSQSRVGRDAGRFEFGIQAGTLEVTFDISGRGKIAVAGSRFGETDNVLAVTGGTGEFKSVGGQVSSFSIGEGLTALVFDLVTR